MSEAVPIITGPQWALLSLSFWIYGLFFTSSIVAALSKIGKINFDECYELIIPAILFWPITIVLIPFVFAFKAIIKAGEPTLIEKYEKDFNTVEKSILEKTIDYKLKDFLQNKEDIYE